MRKILCGVLTCLALNASTPKIARAYDEGARTGKNVFLSMGMKTWINTWQTNLTGNSGKDWTQLTDGPRVGIIPNLSLKVNRLLLSGSFMTTGKYHFPEESFYTTGAGSTLNKLNIIGSRQESDFNVGFYVHPSIVLTMGYKGVNEDFKVHSSVTGNSENKVHMNGVTFGIAGSAPIGNGWSVYGSGVGGFMVVNYTPTAKYNDSGMYEASELGLAWKARNNPLSATIGYKFQLIQTNANPASNTNYTSLPRSEVTRGFMLGLNCVF